jgi:hypothetical protein
LEGVEVWCVVPAAPFCFCAPCKVCGAVFTECLCQRGFINCRNSKVLNNEDDTYYAINRRHRGNYDWLYVNKPNRLNKQFKQWFEFEQRQI